MAQYVKDGHVITASEKAYNVVYREQGYLPVANDLAQSEEQEPSLEEQKQDDGNQHVEIEEEFKPAPEEPVNNPLEIKENTLEGKSYAELKEIAKGLEIPKYANTKQADLITLIQEKLESKNGSGD